MLLTPAVFPFLSSVFSLSFPFISQVQARDAHQWLPSFEVFVLVANGTFEVSLSSRTPNIHSWKRSPRPLCRLFAGIAHSHSQGCLVLKYWSTSSSWSIHHFLLPFSLWSMNAAVVHFLCSNLLFWSDADLVNHHPTIYIQMNNELLNFSVICLW